MPAAEKKRDPLIALRIPPELDARLRAYADETGSTISEIVRDAIEGRLTPLAAVASPLNSTAPRKRTRAATCEHRVRPGNYCRRCDAVV